MADRSLIEFMVIFLDQLHEGVKKSGIMGFCDVCPGEPKQLLVEYTLGGQKFEVLLLIFLCM